MSVTTPSEILGNVSDFSPNEAANALGKHRAEGHHHNVYVALLDPAAGKLRKVRAANPARGPGKPCVYVGMTGLTPEGEDDDYD